jgi:hypothetical protein
VFMAAGTDWASEAFPGSGGLILRQGGLSKVLRRDSHVYKGAGRERNDTANEAHSPVPRLRQICTREMLFDLGVMRCGKEGRCEPDSGEGEKGWHGIP